MVEARDLEAIFPLSYFQESLISQIESEPELSVSYLTCSVHGEIDFEMFERSWQTTVDRNQALRSFFAWKRVQSPVQIVARRLTGQLERFDCREDIGIADSVRVQELVEEDRKRIINPSLLPLNRIVLLQVDDFTHLLVFRFHRLALDGLSAGQMLKETFTTYQMLGDGKAACEPSIPLFQDYVRSLKQSDVSDCRSFWKDLLEDAPEPVSVAGEKPGLASDEGSMVARHQLDLSLETSEALRNLCQRYDVTLNTMAFAAAALMLSKYSGKSRVVFGAEISARPQHGANHERMIGPLTGVLPVKMDVRPTTDLLDFLKSVSETEKRLREYSYVSRLQITRWAELPPGSTVFDSPIVVEDSSLECLMRIECAALTVDDVQIIDASRPHISFRLVPGDHLTLRMVYPGRIEAGAISRMLGHLGSLLEAISAGQGKTLSKLALLTEPERCLVIEESNHREPPFPAATCIHQQCEAQAARTPDAVAVVCEEACVTYEELNQRANRLAHHLIRAGATTESVIAIQLDRGIDFVTAIIAVLKTGAGYLPLDPAYPPERRLFMVRDSGARIVLTDSRMSLALNEPGIRSIRLDFDGPTIDQESPGDPCPTVLPENLAYIIYTSGSTGQPKGVQVTHANVMRLFEATSHLYGFNPTDIFTLFHSFAFDFSVWEIFAALLYGGRLLVIPYILSRSPDEFRRFAEDEQVTVLNQTPSAFRQFIRAGERAGSDARLSLRLVIFGGEALELQSLKPWFSLHGDTKPELVNMYGITETTVHVTYRRLFVENLRLAGGSVIGRPIRDWQVYALNHFLEPLPVGIQGELYVGGAGLARGYRSRPDLTAERFLPNHLGKASGSRLYKSGDLARVLDDGVIEYLGRSDHQVKIRGFRIETGEIESAIVESAGIREAVVLVREDEAGERKLVAYVVPSGEGAIAASEIRALLKQKLPDYMIPSAFTSLDSLPLTRNGKVDRDLLLNIDKEAPGEEAACAGPSNATEEVLEGIWSQVLNIDRIGIDESFFSAGGDSILSIQVVTKARERGLNFSVADLFQYQTIRELAQQIASSDAQAIREWKPFELASEADRSKMPSGVEDAYPLTMMQAGMIFHSDLDRDAGVFLNVNSYHLKAVFDHQALEGAIKQLLRRHAVLRTSFDLAGFSEPLQLVHQEVGVPLKVEDIRAFSIEEQRRTLSEWMEAENRLPFDWTRPALVRFHVHRRTNDSFEFGVTEHHAILDGWSLASMLAELFQNYLDMVDGKEPGPEELHSNLFKGFVALERESLKSRETRQFWVEMLSESPFLEMPRLSPATPLADDPPIREIEVPIPEQVSDAIRKLALTAVVPVKSVLLAAHLRVLMLLGGQRDVVTGVITHGRPEGVNGERELGLFLNTLPFRMNLRGGTFLSLIKDTFDAEREMMRHRYYPMAQTQRDLGGRQLFETIFNFTHFHVYKGIDGVKDIQVLSTRNHGVTNNTFWAHFRMEVATSRIGLAICNMGTQLSNEQMRAIAEYYVNALAMMARDPHTAYERACFLSKRELNLVLHEWNETEEEYEQEECIHEKIERQAKERGDAIAVVCQEERVSYGELDGRANQAAQYLRRVGVGPEVLVGLMVGRRVELVVWMLGILKAGGAYVPIDPGYPEARRELMIEDSGMRVMVRERGEGERSGVREEVVVEEVRREVLRERREGVSSGVVSGNLAYVIYTSGSTGRPKGVGLEHRGVMALMKWGEGAYSEEEMDGVLAGTSICFDLSVFEILVTLGLGGKVIIARSGVEIREELEGGEVRLVNTVPSLMEEVVREGEMGRSVKVVNLAGEALRRGLVEKVYESGGVERVVNLYGPTEDTTYTTKGEERRGERGRVTIGRPIGNTRIYIVDEEGEAAAIGVGGEIYIGSASLGRGYMGRGDLTAERFVPERWSGREGERAYRTGDVGRYRGDGEIEYVGRKDEQVKVRGYRIELGEIEEAMREERGVKEAVVQAVEEGDRGKRLVGYVVEEEGEEISGEEMRRRLRERLPEHMVPGEYVKLEQMPMTPNGKIDRRALPRTQGGQRWTATYVGPRDAIEMALVEIWEAVLALSPLGVRDNFFDVGGHSLLAVRLMARIRQQWGVDLPLASLFQYPSVEEMASVLRGNAVSCGQSLIVRLRSGGSGLPFFCVHPAGGNVLCYSELARGLGLDRPFYAVQSRYIVDRSMLDHSHSIEQMATDYVAAVREVQPEGPYLLGGWSMGGVIAYEMACQIQSHGGCVALVAMFDAFAPDGKATDVDPNDLRLLADFAVDLGLSLERLSVSPLDLYANDLDQNVKHILQQAKLAGLVPPDVEPSQLRHMLDIFRANMIALRSYLPGPGLAPMTLIKASESNHNGDSANGWRKSARAGLEIIDAPGNHYTMMRSPNVAYVVDLLKTSIEKSNVRG